MGDGEQSHTFFVMNRSVFDKKNLFKYLIDIPNHILYGLNYKSFPQISGNFSRIIIGGMGGSAISGMIYKDIMKDYLDIPIEVYSHENLPNYIDKETLFIPISYSGTTKETLNMKKKSTCGKENRDIIK